MRSRSSPETEPARRRGITAGRLVVGALVLAVGVTVVAVVVAVRGGDDVSTRVATGGSGVGEPAPSFTLPGLESGSVDLRDFAGRPVVVNFWASWCQPCRAEFPLLRATAKRHPDLAVVGVTYRDLRRDAQDFARQQRADWPMGFDESGAVARAYRVPSVPTTVFIGRDGVVTQRVYGELTSELLDEELARILTPPS